MFGNNVTSSWANPQQNQQQQQQQQQQQGTSAFGQPSTFGTGGAFGGGAFGQTQPQQQQQQQPAVNPMFGSTTTTNPTGSSGFGAFGGGTTSAFSAKPATGFGAFGGGGTSAFGTTGANAFGSTSTTQPSTTAFGQPSTTGGAFGGSSLFGSKPATTSAFGTTAPATTTGDNPSVAPVTTGSSNPPYSVFVEKDSSTTQNITLHYQSISCMPAYRGSSFEEIRLQDYAQGRKTAGAFGQSAAFGLTPAPQAQPSTSTFGQPAAPTTSTFGTFGQPAQTAQPSTSAFGAFGQPAQQTSAFGSTSGTGGFGAFGQPNQQQQQQQPSTSGFGAFGQTTQQAGTQPSGAGAGLFGGFGGSTTQNKPFGAFGSTPAFGTGTSAFGQQNQQQQQQPATGTTNIFGQPAQSQPQGQTSAFGGVGAFGGSSLFKPSTTFGSTPNQPTTGGFGLFGQNQNQQGQQQQQQPQPQQQQQSSLFGGGGLFGQAQSQPQGQQPQQQGTALFGGTQPAQPATNAFGSGGLFGNNQAQKPAFGGSLFGQSTGAANASTQQSSNIFGQPVGQPTTQPASTGTGLGAFGGGSSIFGSKPTNGSSIFGQSATQQPAGGGLGGSLFGGTGAGNLGTSTFGTTSSTAGPGGQAPLTASVAQPVSTNIPIFSLLPNSTGPLPSVADQSPKRASSYFVDVPTRSPVIGLGSSRNSTVNRLRGFGAGHGFSQSLGGVGGSSLNRGFSASTLTLTSQQKDGRGVLGPEAFLGSSSESRQQSPKKLVLDKKMDPSEVFGKPPQKGAKVSFNPAMGFAAREKEGFGLGASRSVPPAGTPSAQSPAKTTAPLGQADAASPTKEKSADELKEGDYYVKPSLEVLRNTSNVELSSFNGLVVGRKGYGEVQFLDPVDLTSLPRLSALLGKVVQIDNKECCVYPDSVDGNDLKPPPGEGINVRARIVLLGCWPVDKATREPIKDEKHPAFARHLKRLKNIKRTHFDNYTIEDGKWTFTVDHF